LKLYASPTPFCTPIYPRRHRASFGDISAAEIADLARVLRTVLAKLYHGLGNPDFNFTMRSAPAEYVGVKHFHWYVSIIPRLTRMAGLKWDLECLSPPQKPRRSSCEMWKSNWSELIL
jgi:UDPglucose--hexose-1-phosphate uridylyltransferase